MTLTLREYSITLNNISKTQNILKIIQNSSYIARNLNLYNLKSI